VRRSVDEVDILREALQETLAALKYIRDHDPGTPAYYRAADAVEEVERLLKEAEITL
jgi:hypothetical protein